MPLVDQYGDPQGLERAVLPLCPLRTVKDGLIGQKVTLRVIPQSDMAPLRQSAVLHFQNEVAGGPIIRGAVCHFDDQGLHVR